jgi:hypothetical protein
LAITCCLSQAHTGLQQQQQGPAVGLAWFNQAALNPRLLHLMQPAACCQCLVGHASIQGTQLLLLLLSPALCLCLWVMRALHPSGPLEQAGLLVLTPACCQSRGEVGPAHHMHVWGLLLPVLMVVVALAVALLLVVSLLPLLLHTYLQEVLLKLQVLRRLLPLQQHHWCHSPPQPPCRRQLVYPGPSPPTKQQQQQQLLQQ